MDLNKLKRNYSTKEYSPVDFLFIGHLRKEKGIEFLLKECERFYSICPMST